jgi:HK97 family phage major capsid protein
VGRRDLRDFEDSAADLGSVISELVADARDRAEGSAFATGDGTTQPKGLITAISATAGSTVTATTRGSFTTNSVADVFNVYNALPARARKAQRVTWLANNTTFSTIRQMSPSGGQGSSFWAHPR